MQKLIKRVVLLATMFVLVFTVVGCSGSGKDKTKKANKSTEVVYTSSDGEVKLHVKKDKKKVRVEWLRDGVDYGTNGYIKYSGDFVKNTESTIGWYTINEPKATDKVKITLKMCGDGVTFDYEWEYK